MSSLAARLCWLRESMTYYRRVGSHGSAHDCFVEMRSIAHELIQAGCLS